MSDVTLGAPPAVRRRRGWFHRLYYGETRVDFVGKRKWWFIASGIVILAGLISLSVRGLNLDIEFVGGTSWQAPANGVSVQQVENAIGLPGATVTLLGSGSHEQVQVEAKLSNGQGGTTNKANAQLLRVQHELAQVTKTPFNSVSVEQVGPTWGSQITHKAIVALIVFFIMIALYISIFFEWKMALAAIIAVAHDILVTVGIYSLTAFLVTPDTVVAFLTILGYSLYDTIVVFDRVRDNAKGIGSTGKLTYSDLVDLSMNQTLARSINTSLVAVLPILSVLVIGANLLGAVTLQYFGLALLIGLLSGAYSSLFIASPLVAVLKEREGRWQTIRQRLEARGSAHLVLSPAMVAAGYLDEREATSSAAPRGRRGSRPTRPAVGPDEAPAPLRPSAGRAQGGQTAPTALAGGDEAELDGQAGGSDPTSDGGLAGGAGAGTGAAAAASSGRSATGRNAPGGARPQQPGRPGQPPRPRKKRRR